VAFPALGQKLRRHWKAFKGIRKVRLSFKDNDAFRELALDVDADGRDFLHVEPKSSPPLERVVVIAGFRRCNFIH